MKRHPLYSIWRGIKSRCYGKTTNRHYRWYGARGIQMHSAWRADFWTFVADVTAEIGERPAGKSIDRIDNGGHYEPGNLRWATQTEQCANRRRRVACMKGHPFTPETTTIGPDGVTRICLICQAATRARSRARAKARRSQGGPVL